PFFRVFGKLRTEMAAETERGTARSKPRVSVIIPVHNGASTLEACLPPLLQASPNLAEVLVIDDPSSDGSGAVARALGAKVVASRGRGPGGAGVLGPRGAGGDLLVFVDAGVRGQPSTIQRVVDILEATPSVSAVFGSYDGEPFEPNFLSQYKNLFHH